MMNCQSKRPIYVKIRENLAALRTAARGALTCCWRAGWGGQSNVCVLCNVMMTKPTDYVPILARD